MNDGDIAVIGLVGLGAFALYGYSNKPADTAEDLSTGVTLRGTDIPIREQSELRGEDVLNMRTIDEEGGTATYPVNINDLTAPEQRAIQRGFYDIENDNLQFGLLEGAERKLRDRFNIDVDLDPFKIAGAIQFPFMSGIGWTSNWISNKISGWIDNRKAIQTTGTTTPTPQPTKAETRTAQIQKSASTITRISSSSRRRVAEAAERFEKATTTSDKKSAIRDAWKAAGL